MNMYYITGTCFVIQAMQYKNYHFGGECEGSYGSSYTTRYQLYNYLIATGVIWAWHMSFPFHGCIISFVHLLEQRANLYQKLLWENPDMSDFRTEHLHIPATQLLGDKYLDLLGDNYLWCVTMEHNEGKLSTK